MDRRLLTNIEESVLRCGVFCGRGYPTVAVVGGRRGREGLKHPER